MTEPEIGEKGMTTENGLPGVGKVRRWIAKLEERAAWLEFKIGELDENSPKAGHYWVELLALRWALPVLEAEYDSVVRLRALVIDAEDREMR